MKTRSQILPLLLVTAAAVGAMVGADQLMRAVVSAEGYGRFEREINDQIARLNEGITDARAVLAALAAAGHGDCGATSRAARSEAIAASTAIVDIARVDASGKAQCANLSIAFHALDGGGVKPQMLGPSETMATGLYGASERTALVVSRQLEPDGGTLLAIVPYARLVTPISSGAEDIRLRLAYGAAPVLVEGSGQPHPAQAIEAANEAFEAAATAPDRHVIERADAAYAPLALTMTAPVAVSWYDPNRLVADISIGSVVYAIGYLGFVRRRLPRRLKVLIDRAIRRNEFEPLYRPVIDLTSGRIAAVRMEIVWHQGKRDLSQDEFMADVLDAQEDLKLLRALLLRSRQALAPMFKLRPRLLLKIAVGFETLLRPQFVDMMRRAMVGSGIRQSQIVVCLPAVAEASDPRHAFDVVKALQSCGIGVELLESSEAIGFSFKSDQATAGSVGLDRRLYAALQAEGSDTAARARLWIEQMIEHARPMEIRICAYDVPDDATLQALKGLGVREAEGRVIVPALTAATLTALVARAGIEPSPEEQPEEEIAPIEEIDAGEDDIARQRA